MSVQEPASVTGDGPAVTDPGGDYRRLRIPDAVAVVLTLVASLAEAYLVLYVWVTCDIGGINAGVSQMTVLFFVLPGLLFAHAVALWMLCWAGAWLSSFTRWSPLVTVVVLVGVTAVGAYLVATVVATPGEPSLTCATGVPPWWPSWLPHGSFGLTS